MHARVKRGAGGLEASLPTTGFGTTYHEYREGFDEKRKLPSTTVNIAAVDTYIALESAVTVRHF